MLQSDQFFQAVLEHPEDNTLRLVYADWLEECGDPVGEFIRVQIELDQTPHSDLYWRTLKNRETELLDEHLEDWLGPSARRVWKGFAQAQYQPFFAGRGSCRLHRGFRETARMRGQTFFQHADEIFRSLPLRELHIFLGAQTSGIGKELVDLSACENLSRIHDLILEYPLYAAFDPDAESQNGLERLLNASPIGELRSLQIYYTFEIQPLARAVSRSRELTNLQTLALHSMYLTSGIGNTHAPRHGHRPHSLAVARHLPALKELIITDHQLTDAAFHLLFQAPWFEQLTLLDLTGSELGEESFRRLAASPLCRQLETLRLSRRHYQEETPLLSVDGFRALGQADFSSLKELALAYQNISPDALAALLRSSRYENLEVLDLTGNPLGDAGARILAESEVLANLQVLKLHGCLITDAGLLAIARSPNLSQVEQLFIGNSNIGPAGLEEFLNTPFVERLRTLSFAGCDDWGNPIFSRIARAEGLKNLAELDLTRQRLNSVRVKQLIASESLSELAHLSWFQPAVGKRKHDLEDLLHKRWPGRVRV